MQQPWVIPHAKDKDLAAGQSRLIRPVVVAGPRLANKRPLSEISFRLFMLPLKQTLQHKAERQK
jgi:hypothetical protein